MVDFSKYKFARLCDGGLIVHLIPKVGHTTISQLIAGKNPKHIIPSEDVPGFRFMCVRHPLDRIVSAWAFFTSRPVFHEHMERIGYKKDMSFSEWLDFCLDKYGENVHTDKQILFTGGHEIDFLVPLEDLDEAWKLLSGRFKLPSMKRFNASIHKPWEEYYDHKQKAAAEIVFSEDMELYNKALNWRKDNG